MTGPAFGPATGIGSMPGGDAREAAKAVTGTFEDFPHLPELPARGPGADMIGRTAGMLVEVYARVEPSGWRIGDRPGRDTKRARSWLGEDLDALEEFTQGYEGPLKVQAVGPWTLASTLELRHGDRMLADLGAVRDLAESLTEGLKLHIAEMKKRVPRAAGLIVQLDEPALPGVLKGTVPTASGFGKLRAVEEAVARELLAGVLQAVRDAEAETAVHCCAPDVPIDLLRKAGADHISFDATGITATGHGTATARDEQLGEAIEAGVGLMLGVVPATDPARAADVGVNRLLDKILSLTRLGFSPAQLAEATTITPACGLAGATPPWARQALILAHRTADALADKAS